MPQVRDRWWKRLFGLGHVADASPGDPHGAVGPRGPDFAVSLYGRLAARPGNLLRQLGMVEAFIWPGADFSRMDGTLDLYLSEVLHQAEVEVDEQGTEAAAATAALMMLGSASGTHVPAFHADRPFLFLIRDPRSAAIVFLGRLTNPV